MEGAAVASAIWDMALGAWQRYGPYAVTVSDGDLDVELVRLSGDPHVMGMAVFSAGSSPPPPPPPGSGAVLREYWTGIPGVAVADLTSDPDFPSNPSGSDFLDSFEAPTDWADEYGTRLRAYLTAPATGNYVFWIASDDGSELWLSLDDNPASRSLIASVPGWTSSREWTKYPAQQSVPIPLAAGHRYYIEALQKEGGGGDNLAVGWQLPDGTLERPIPASRLSPVDPLDGDGDGVPDADERAAGTNPEDKNSVPGAPAGGGGGNAGHDPDADDSGNCGALGIEAVFILGLLGLIRRSRRR